MFAYFGVCANLCTHMLVRRVRLLANRFRCYVRAYGVAHISLERGVVWRSKLYLAHDELERGALVSGIRGRALHLMDKDLRKTVIVGVAGERIPGLDVCSFEVAEPSLDALVATVCIVDAWMRSSGRLPGMYWGRLSLVAVRQHPWVKGLIKWTTRTLNNCRSMKVHCNNSKRWRGPMG